MTDAGSIWKSKLSRLQECNLERMNPLVELMEEWRERRQGRGEPRSDEGEAQDGSKRSKVDVVADYVHFLDG